MTDWQALMRPLTPSDIDDLMVLQARMAAALPDPRWYFTSTREEWLADIAEGVVIGIRVDGRLAAIGCAQTGDDHPDHSYAAVLGEDHRHTLDFRDVIVDPDFRRQGIHSAYLARFRRQAEESGCRAMYATADPDNVPSVSSFIKAGYKPVLTQPAYDGRIRTYLKCTLV